MKPLIKLNHLKSKSLFSLIKKRKKNSKRTRSKVRKSKKRNSKVLKWRNCKWSNNSKNKCRNSKNNRSHRNKNLSSHSKKFRINNSYKKRIRRLKRFLLKFRRVLHSCQGKSPRKMRKTYFLRPNLERGS